MAKPVVRESETSVVIKDVLKRYTLNMMDLVQNNNKFYNLEVVQATDGNFYVYTHYGRVGGTVAKDFRKCACQSDAEREGEKIVKSKIKKGYVEIKLVKADVGSDIGKTKIEANSVSLDSLEKAGIKLDTIKTESKLHIEVQKLVSSWFGSTAQFVEANLDSKRCPLGQLGLEQIAKGKALLDAARLVIHGNKSTDKLNELTSLYYSNIPHVLPRFPDRDLLRLLDDDIN